MGSFIKSEMETRVEGMTIRQMGYRIDELRYGEINVPGRYAGSLWSDTIYSELKHRIDELALIAHRLRRMAANKPAKGEEGR